MAGKQSGIASTVTVDDNGGVARNISNDIKSFSFGTPRGTQDVTGIDVAGMQQILLRTDGQITLNGVFNPDANMSHDVFKTVPSAAAVEREVVIDFGTPTLTMTVIFTDYSISMGDDGALTWSAKGQLSNGVPPVWA